jgi:hypothetical protein
MSKKRIAGSVIAFGMIFGPLTNDLAAGRTWSIGAPMENEQYSTTANISVTCGVFSDDPQLPANNLESIVVNIRNVNSGLVMQEFEATSSGMNYTYGNVMGTLNNPQGGFSSGDADIEVWWAQAKRATRRIQISSPPPP